MEIIVINRKIETKHIVLIKDIKDMSNYPFRDRDVGFVIYLIDGSSQVFKEFVFYGVSDEQFEETKLKYKMLQEKVEQKWKEDCHNLPTFNL